MNAKKYLEGIADNTAKIHCKLAEIEQLRSLATSISSLSSGAHVQSSSESDRIGRIVSDIVDKETELDAMVDDYIDEKENESSLLNSLMIDYSIRCYIRGMLN